MEHYNYGGFHDVHIAVDIFWPYQLGQGQASGRWEFLGSVSNQVSLMKNNQRELRAITGVSVLIMRSMWPQWDSMMWKNLEVLRIQN